jgi:uncharacterized membrane protein
MNSSMGFLIGAAGLALLSIPLILKVVPPNQFYGFRTPSTVASPSLWYRANAFAGWALLVGAVVSAFLIWGMSSGALPSVAPDVVAFALPVVIAVLASFVYLHRIKGTGSEPK